MATPAVAQETVFALRHKIAKIEGRLAEHLGGGEEDSAASEAIKLRRHGLVVPEYGFLATGAERFDAALGGGLPRAALTEIHGPATRDAAAVAGFVLALVSSALGAEATPLLWIGTSEIFREAGFPYAPGMQSLYEIDPTRLMVAQAPKLIGRAVDCRGSRTAERVLGGASRNPRQPRAAGPHGDAAAAPPRPGRRAPRVPAASGRPPGADGGARPARRVVRARRIAAHLRGAARPLDRSARLHRRRQQEPNRTPAQFTLEWNPHDRSFQERRAENPVPVVPVSQHRARVATKTGTLLAFWSEEHAAGRQPPGEEFPAHRRLG